MPTRPPRRCPSCRRLVIGACPTCDRRINQLRGTRTDRGYSNDWLRLRRYHLDLEPTCRFCAAHGLVVGAEQVDHIVPFTSIDDPRRLDPTNLRSLCASCHATHHAHGVSRLYESPDRNRPAVDLTQTQNGKGPALG